MNFHLGYRADRAELIARADEQLLTPYLLQQRLRKGVPLKMLEFGTNLTRCADWLQKHGKLIICDIDSGALTIAESRLRDLALEFDTQAMLLRSVANIHAIPPLDCVYAVLIFKNGPSTLYIAILRQLMRAVAQGGAVLLHLPVRIKTGLAGDHDVESYIRTVPLELLYEIFRDYNLSLVLAEEDRQITASDTVYFRVLSTRK